MRSETERQSLRGVWVVLVDNYSLRYHMFPLTSQRWCDSNGCDSELPTTDFVNSESEKALFARHFPGRGLERFRL